MNFEEMSEAEILGIANPIMDNLMKASTVIDHEKHTRDFTERLKNIVTAEMVLVNINGKFLVDHVTVF